ncbi:MAG: beta-N-acetylhexosaminidase [Oscillospiraceae bacterium]
MLRVKLVGDLNEFKAGLEALLPEISMVNSDDGIPVTVQKGDHLVAKLSPSAGAIEYGEKVQFFRALSLLSQFGTSCDVEETPCFDKNGIMFDMSRNAVMKPVTVEFYLRKMALMGLNLGMMYTEDTYEVENYPYFGYLRGAYSKQELRALDDYADMLGIELVPCIQTLAHLERALHWEEMQNLRDTPHVLLVDSEETYAFIAQIVKDATEPYRSRRIHIGMDEAGFLGLGRYLKKHGYHTSHELMIKHLNRVNEIIKSMNLEPMIWSDMFFSSSSPTYFYYDLESVIPQEVIDQVPENISLVYWHYAGIEERYYDKMIERHRLFKSKTIFAGGLCTWIGPIIKYDIAIASTVLALKHCKAQNIREVFATAWGDNGQECNLLAALYGLQVYAEIGYKGAYDETETKARFRACTGADGQAFLDISKLDSVEGAVSPPNEQGADPCKYVIYDDPLLPQFEKDTEKFALASYYEKMIPLFEKHRDQNPQFALLFDFYVKYAKVMSQKCFWHENASKCVAEKDRAMAKTLADGVPDLIDSIKKLRDVWENLWFSTNKPYGFDVIEGRLGGLIARMETARIHMAQFANGETDSIPGLSDEKLPYLYFQKEGELGSINCWGYNISNGYTGYC